MTFKLRVLKYKKKDDYDIGDDIFSFLAAEERRIRETIPKPCTPIIEEERIPVEDEDVPWEDENVPTA